MSLSEALEADRAERIVEAADLYERAIGGGADIEGILNLVVLYWESTSMGFYAHHRLSDAFVEKANFRYRQLLAEATRQHSSDPRVEFWQKYIASIEEGAELSLEECKLMRVANPDYFEPEMVLVQAGQESPAAAELLRRCEKEGTIRAKYVASVTEAALHRR
jgi:hypothetical protein